MTPICPDCEPITRVMDNGEALARLRNNKKHKICPEAARQSCLDWLSEIHRMTPCEMVFPSTMLGQPVTIDNFFPLSSSYVARIPYHYIMGNPYGEVAAEWPFTVLGSPAPLYLVLRQTVRQKLDQTNKIKIRFRQALLDSPQWRQAVESYRRSCRELSQFYQGYDMTNTIPHRQAPNVPDWESNREQLQYLAAMNCLQSVNLPDTAEMVAMLLGTLEGDIDWFTLEVRVTSFLLYNPERPEFYDIIQSVSGSGIRANNELWREAQSVMTGPHKDPLRKRQEEGHVQFIREKFPVKKISGRTLGRQKAGSSAYAPYIKWYKASKQRLQDWKALRTQVEHDARKAFGASSTASSTISSNPKTAWENCRKELNRAGFHRPQK